MKLHITRTHEGVSTKSTLSSCPFWSPSGCKVIVLPCGYGLTETKVPLLCPLRSGAVTTKVTLLGGDRP